MTKELTIENALENLKNSFSNKEENSNNQIKKYVKSRIPIFFKHIVSGFTILEHKNTLILQVEEENNTFVIQFKHSPVSFVAKGNTLHELTNDFNYKMTQNFLRIQEETELIYNEIKKSKDRAEQITIETRYRKILFENNCFLSQFRMVYNDNKN